MIASVRGEVLEHEGTSVVVEVAGVGYRVSVTPQLAAELRRGSEVFLHVHHHVREDAQVLYGFPSAEERRVFETLIGTHGVGPAMALAILSVHSPDALVEAVAAQDVAALCLVPGVGKKTAARLLVELQNRLEVPAGGGEGAAAPAGGASVGGSVRTDVREALAGLGYGADEIAAVLPELPENDTGEALREALRRLAVA